MCVNLGSELTCASTFSLSAEQLAARLLNQAEASSKPPGPANAAGAGIVMTLEGNVLDTVLREDSCGQNCTLMLYIICFQGGRHLEFSEGALLD